MLKCLPETRERVKDIANKWGNDASKAKNLEEIVERNCRASIAKRSGVGAPMVTMLVRSNLTMATLCTQNKHFTEIPPAVLQCSRKKCILVTLLITRKQVEKMF